MDVGLLFLRPSSTSTFRTIPSHALGASYARFYTVWKAHRPTTGTQPRMRNTARFSSSCIHLHNEPSLRQTQYPRYSQNVEALTCRVFAERYNKPTIQQSRVPVNVFLQGRMMALRSAGKKLAFLDLLQDGERVQAVCNLRNITETDITEAHFRDALRCLSKGDIIELRGYPGRTATGEMSLHLTALPRLLASCLHPLPIGLQDGETKIKNRHVDLLVNPKIADILRLRSQIIQFIRQFLIDDGHIEVQTPIMADGTGGAIARPFQTSATEFPSRNINLRVAPELWLKRLVVGGFDRIFEIGPSFRNEGIDHTHNPEFTTCEFYRTYTDLEGLIALTEKMISGLRDHLQRSEAALLSRLDMANLNFNKTYDRIDFVPAIEQAIGHSLPQLTHADATRKVSEILSDHEIDFDKSTTLPQMLDRLSAKFLEPRCRDPTWIVNHPECLSSLSKSFIHPSVNQMVSARAELFVNHREIINTYEEENSPSEQRRKFQEQIRYREDGENSSIDESYVEALEWGMPPTGGWGCGIDRLCMLFSGSSRIADVLTFGTLRNVVSLARHDTRLS